MAQVFVGLGSNVGDRLEQISRAVQRLGRLPGVRVSRMATIYDTEPVGPPQPEYLNTVIEMDTALSPHQLLETLKLLERQLGRVPSTQRWGPRVIDLDILLYDDRVLNEPALIIPHPRMHERRFVLEPLAQLAPQFVHPVLKQTIAQLLAALPASTLHASRFTLH
jgi:2-amino-4-hydroxy-6-hydroxymethyldihydropteridine diphosphokinase